MAGLQPSGPDRAEKNSVSECVLVCPNVSDDCGSGNAECGLVCLNAKSARTAKTQPKQINVFITPAMIGRGVGHPRSYPSGISKFFCRDYAFRFYAFAKGEQNAKNV